MTRPTRIDVDLAALQANLAVARKAAPASKVASCVKADAYGHGALEVCRKLASQSEKLAFASIDEAAKICDAGVACDALLLEGCFTPDEWRESASRRYTAVVHSPTQVQQLLEQAEKIDPDQPLKLWLKLDSGMHRLGLSEQELIEALHSFSRVRTLRVETILTHFASADLTNHPQTPAQMEAFGNLYAHLKKSLTIERSCANSAAILSFPQSHFEWIRPGYMLYGASPFAGKSAAEIGLRPVMTFSTEIIAIRNIATDESVGYQGTWKASRPSKIATLAVGYGDGYPRTTGIGAEVYLHGKTAPVVGNVSMDLTCIDVTDVDQAQVGDRVELWGSNIEVSQLASSIGMSGYELLTRLTGRVTKHYIG